MRLKTISFRLPDDKLQALDSVVEVQNRDRSFVLNEAVTQYLSLNDYHRSLIEEGIQQDDAGEVIDHQALMNTAARWVRNPKARRHLRIAWTRIASEQLKAAIAFVAEDNPSAAGNQLQIIKRAVDQLADFPEMGRPGRVDGHARTRHPNYSESCGLPFEGEVCAHPGNTPRRRGWPTQL